MAGGGSGDGCSRTVKAVPEPGGGKTVKDCHSPPWSRKPPPDMAEPEDCAGAVPHAIAAQACKTAARANDMAP
ncbi:MAG: hypothetical protein OHK0024_11630 [Thalassobaculales bacterium]